MRFRNFHGIDPARAKTNQMKMTSAALLVASAFSTSIAASLRFVSFFYLLCMLFLYFLENKKHSNHTARSRHDSNHRHRLQFIRIATWPVGVEDTKISPHTQDAGCLPHELFQWKWVSTIYLCVFFRIWGIAQTQVGTRVCQWNVGGIGNYLRASDTIPN
jgi:hypothetical protein